MLNSLQACRALAAIVIVLAHANLGIFGKDKYFGSSPFGQLFNFAHAGVDFFFVLSGFLILYAHTPDLGQPRRLGAYLWKRYSRVFLFYWVLLAAVLPIFFLVPQFGNGYERDPRVIAGSILLLPHPHNQFILAVAWTLPFEMLYYLLFGILVINKRIGVTVFVLWTGGILAHAWIETFPWSFVFNNLHLRIVAGMGVCLILQRWRIPAPRLIAGLGASLFLSTALIHVFHGLTGWTYIVGFTLGSSLVVAGLVEADRSGLIQTPRLLVYLGDATYAIYLVHFLALSAIAKSCKALGLDAHVPLLALFALHVIGSIGIGCLCHHWVEKPLHAWSKRFFGRAKPSIPAAEAPTVEPEIRKAA